LQRETLFSPFILAPHSTRFTAKVLDANILNSTYRLCVAVPLWQDFNTELGISYADLNNTYASNMAALSVGCIIFIPIALRIGRRPVYIVTTLIMLASAIWQAKMVTLGDMIGTNVIMGIAGAVNEALFQVTVSICSLPWGNGVASNRVDR
jgi:MFS family permease